uniref:Uncharacterized protein n=1 Tax=Microcebus murinus TaxID=30608 RepID=A0A8C5XK65_MICMU
PTTAAPRWTAEAECRGAGRSVSPGRVPGCAVMGGETRGPEKYYGLYWEIWRGSGRGEPRPTPQDPAGK